MIKKINWAFDFRIFFFFWLVAEGKQIFFRPNLECYTNFKGAQSYFSKLRFHLYVGNLSSTGQNRKFQLNRSNSYVHCVYKLSYMVTISP